MAPTLRRPFWHWLLLLAPSVQLILVAQWQWPLARFFFPNTYLPSVALLWNNLLLALALSLVLGFWMAWKIEHLGRRLGIGVVFGVCVAVVNLSVGFIGCAVNGVFK